MKKGYQVLVSLIVLSTLVAGVVVAAVNDSKNQIRQDYINFGPFLFMAFLFFGMMISLITIYVSGKNIWQYLIAAIAAIISLISAISSTTYDSSAAGVHIISLIVAVVALCITNKTLRWLWIKYPDEE